MVEHDKQVLVTVAAAVAIWNQVRKEEDIMLEILTNVRSEPSGDTEREYNQDRESQARGCRTNIDRVQSRYQLVSMKFREQMSTILKRSGQRT
jgi:hypothetical protein